MAHVQAGPSKILAAEDRYSAAPDAPGLSPAETVVHRFWRHHPGTVAAPLAGQPRGPWPTGATDRTAAAYVNHGRWCVDCPFGCGSAQYASRADRRFFCIECGNDSTSGWVTVIWPAPLDIAAIEAALGVRPQVATRNWQPGETVADLLAENQARGLR